MKTTYLAVLFFSFAGALAALPAFADTVVYDNTASASLTAPTLAVPISSENGTPFEVADSFVLGSSTTVSGATFFVWLPSGDSLATLNWAISTSPVDSYTTSSGIVAENNSPTDAERVQTLVQGGTGGYEADKEYISFNQNLAGSLSLSAGTTYYLQLSEAVTGAGSNLVLWDASGGNSTAYITSSGDPSSYPTGSIGYSQSFRILAPGEGESEGDGDDGHNDSPVPEPSSFLMLGSGLLAMAGVVRRKLLA